MPEDLLETQVVPDLWECLLVTFHLMQADLVVCHLIWAVLVALLRATYAPAALLPTRVTCLETPEATRSATDERLKKYEREEKRAATHPPTKQLCEASPPSRVSCQA